MEIASKEDFNRLEAKIDQLLRNYEDKRAPSEEWITEKEFRELMGISADTSTRWREQGIMAYSRIGDKIYYSREDVNKALTAKKIKPFTQLVYNKKTA
jgi:hypothetical protein